MTIKRGWPEYVPDAQCAEIEARTREKFNITERDIMRADWAETVAGWAAGALGFGAMIAALLAPIGPLGVRVPVALLLVWLPASIAAYAFLERRNHRYLTARLVPQREAYRAELSARFAAAKDACMRAEWEKLDHTSQT